MHFLHLSIFEEFIFLFQGVCDSSGEQPEVGGLEPILSSGPSSQGLAYIAGFLTNKLAPKYPLLGSFSKDVQGGPR